MNEWFENELRASMKSEPEFANTAVANETCPRSPPYFMLLKHCWGSVYKFNSLSVYES